MAYTKTTWTDGTTAITATQLNRIEQGVEDAHLGDTVAMNKIHHGRFNSTGTAVSLPSGWSSNRVGTGQYRVTHNLGTVNYTVVAMSGYLPYMIGRNDVANVDPSNSVILDVQDDSGTATDADVAFMLFED